jgi:hypothetical protein
MLPVDQRLPVVALIKRFNPTLVALLCIFLLICASYLFPQNASNLFPQYEDVESAKIRSSSSSSSSSASSSLIDACSELAILPSLRDKIAQLIDATSSVEEKLDEIKSKRVQLPLEVVAPSPIPVPTGI